MKKYQLRNLIREEIRRIISEEETDVGLDSKSIEDEIKAAKAGIQAAQARVKVAKDKLMALQKKKQEMKSK
jgi:hypothetical protein